MCSKLGRHTSIRHSSFLYSHLYFSRGICHHVVCVMTSIRMIQYVNYINMFNNVHKNVHVTRLLVILTKEKVFTCTFTCTHRVLRKFPQKLTSQYVFRYHNPPPLFHVYSSIASDNISHSASTISQLLRLRQRCSRFMASFVLQLPTLFACLQTYLASKLNRHYTKLCTAH